MPYVTRDSNGNVIKASIQPVHGAENISYDHPDLVAFLQQNGQQPSDITDALGELRKTDADMTRVIEDVVMVLLKKNILRMTDMPQAVQDRMSYRVKLRMKIQSIFNQASGNNSNANFANSSYERPKN